MNPNPCLKPALNTGTFQREMQRGRYFCIRTDIRHRNDPVELEKEKCDLCDISVSAIYPLSTQQQLFARPHLDPTPFLSRQREVVVLRAFGLACLRLT